MITKPYLWQQADWRRLSELVHTARMPHALLLSGASGLAKTHLAECLANALLCEQPQEGVACGQCNACRQRSAGHHPDFFNIEPQQEGGAITVLQIRALLTALTMTAHRGGYRVIIITSAHAMNESAENALLKTLEEPPPHSLLILISNQPTQLAATTRSRCFHMSIGVPKFALVYPWLQQHHSELTEAQWRLYWKHAGGAPMTTLALADSTHWQQAITMMQSYLEVIAGRRSAIEVASSWQTFNAAEVLEHCLHVLHKLLCLKMTTEQSYEQDWPTSLTQLLHAILGACSMQTLLTAIDHCYAKLRLLSQSSSYNKLLLFEDILLDWE